jgi:hypothetical protein
VPKVRAAIAANEIAAVRSKQDPHQGGRGARWPGIALASVKGVHFDGAATLKTARRV